MDPASFRSQFPVFERVSYLNAGTEGPVPAKALEAARSRLELEAREGRAGRPFFDSTLALRDSVRAAYADVLHCASDHVALTGSTTDGVNSVLAALDLGPGDEVLTSDEEHPGVLAPLGAAHRYRGVEVRIVPFAEIASEVRPSTRLVACSHVSWVSGQVVDAAGLAAGGAMVLLDAAQALGAIPVEVRELGCDFYACSGQKWLCGPEGSGCLFVSPDRLEELHIPWPSYSSLADAHEPFAFEPAAGASRLDLGFPAGLRSAWALASLEVLGEAGWDWVHERAATLAAGLAESLAQRGIEVLPRGRSTLVSFLPPGGDAEAEVARLAEERVIVRNVPLGRGPIRASVGAWSSEEELERLVELVAP